MGVYLRSADRAVVREGIAVRRSFVGNSGVGVSGRQLLGLWSDTDLGIWHVANVRIRNFANDAFANHSDYSPAATLVIDRRFRR
jgi:hypothetical protein